MLGQPEPISPVSGLNENFPRGAVKFGRPGFVSLWVGAFPSIEDAEAYFGIPDEIGVYLPPDAFIADFELENLPPESLEAHFERISPRPLADLLREAAFGLSFLDLAVGAARQQGIEQAQGLALVYDFDYRLKSPPIVAAGPLRFVGAFPFVPVGPELDLRPFREAAREIGCSLSAVLFLLAALEDAVEQLGRERGAGAGHLSARDYCGYLLRCRGDDTRAVLLELEIRTSAEVGKIIFGLARKGLVDRHSGDLESDFQGLFAL